MPGMRTSGLEYDLPAELIAQQPIPQRRASRMLVVSRDGQQWSDRLFADLPAMLSPTDVLVINNTKVVPAKFFLRRQTGGRIEGLWQRATDAGTWEVLLRSAGRLKIGEVLSIESRGPTYIATVIHKSARGNYRLSIEPAANAVDILNDVGRTPLPPYIKRTAAPDQDLDSTRYQTVYAAAAGAVAAPTAGLHFDRSMLDTLREMGITVLEVTLHVGLGTFAPIEVDDLKDHTMHSEHYEVSLETWDVLCQARRRGRRIVAVGTTSARVLETVAGSSVLAGQTKLFIYPPGAFAMVSALLTNFHLPRSTLLAMIYAFGGTDLMRRAYTHAVGQRYRFFSYGDAMLIE